jgi:hypothetical protein
MKWTVVGPEYGVVIPITDEGQGPLEYGCDVVEVEADTKADARVLGVHELRKIPRGYIDRYSDENPFAGLRVFPSEQPE